jgi:hypothetical protein
MLLVTEVIVVKKKAIEVSSEVNGWESNQS